MIENSISVGPVVCWAVRASPRPRDVPKYFDLAYAPYGEDYADSGTPDLDFTGQNQETASGLYDFAYREYHPNSGRWIQPDPAGLAVASVENPKSGIVMGGLALDKNEGIVKSIVL